MPQNAIVAFANLLRKTAEAEERAATELLPHFAHFTEKVGEVKSTYEKTEIAAKNRFNVFDTLTRHHLEELHSNFIAYLLNPKEKHDFGDGFLMFFIEILNENLENDRKIKDFDYKNTKIHKEYTISGGRLDIFIETTNFNLIIENKIYANEQNEQISKYIRFAKASKKPYLVVYLTPEGNESNTANGAFYLPIAYRETILTWLEKCLAHTKNYPLAHAGIHFYKKTLAQKILHITDNQLLMNIKKLFEDKNPDALALLEHWSEIAPAVKSYGDDLRIDFLKKVKERLNTNNHNFYAASSVWKKIDDNQVFGKGKGLTTEEYKSLDGSVFGIEFWDDNWGLYYGIFSPKKEIRESLYEKNYSVLSGLEKDGGLWLLKRFIYKEESFTSSKMTHYLATNMDALVTQFVTEVEEFLAAWRETIAELNKEFK